ncbi:uncharacterized protein LTR77_010006 [Saxophila tyrrhenica]|uniref:deoxyribose-phosphate aldolase n=1 Tax=Saxophila tyrrhenica TaxID=1690608 RepID=A0AAV9NXI7_9PEZI|nr:hypothetical protein LTR77_010006 [Saxophila tyrrhenica]
MGSRYTDAEWSMFIEEVEHDLKVSSEPYSCPSIRSSGFTKTIDHTLLKLETKAVQIDELCAEARVNGFASVCVRANFVHQCAADLRGSGVRVACVVGFHEGTHDLLYKLQEAKTAIQSGADELDIVINYLELQARKYNSIYQELVALRSQAQHPVQLKLILETSQLNRSQIIAGCAMAAAAGFDFVKTSTGFNGPGATVENVRLMAACCQKLAEGNGPGRKRMQVKASGGIRTLEDAVKMLEAGASRLGTSGGVWIAREAKEKAEQGMSTNGAVYGEGRRPSLQTRLFTDY